MKPEGVWYTLGEGRVSMGPDKDNRRVLGVTVNNVQCKYTCTKTSGGVSRIYTNQNKTNNRNDVVELR